MISGETNLESAMRTGTFGGRQGGPEETLRLTRCRSARFERNRSGRRISHLRRTILEDRLAEGSRKNSKWGRSGGLTYEALDSLHSQKMEAAEQIGLG